MHEILNIKMSNIRTDFRVCQRRNLAFVKVELKAASEYLELHCSLNVQLVQAYCYVAHVVMSKQTLPRERCYP